VTGARVSFSDPEHPSDSPECWSPSCSPQLKSAASLDFLLIAVIVDKVRNLDKIANLKRYWGTIEPEDEAAIQRE
jgi:hypothetical protein